MSVAVHAAVLAAFLLHPKPYAVELDSMGAVELLMVEQRGAEVSQAAPPPAQPTKQDDNKQQREVAKPPTPPAAFATTRGDEAGPLAANLSPEPAQPTAQAEKQEEAAKPEKPQAPSPPAKMVFNLSGTDSDSNAVVTGGHVLPASVDNKFRNRPPVFPEEAAMRGEYGTVTLLIHVNAAGVPDGIDVTESSGFADLDRSAIAAVRKWHFHPAMQDGRTVPFDMPFRFAFERP